MNCHDLIQRYWAAANARDWASFATLHCADVVYEVPQTRERVRGLDAYLEFNQTWPGAWRAHVLQVIAQEQQGMSVIDFVVNGQSATGISVFELRDGLIARITDYWPEPYEPPARNTARIERY